MAAGALFAVALLVSLAFGLLLYAFVRQEAADRTAMDREAAERRARRDTDTEER
ncbi:MAG: hypothetical protein U5J98_08440 [Halobacteriales archaeon]|nr:hypothetical protein [Halobacteriales archaeon]